MDIQKELESFKTVATAKGWSIDGETTQINYRFYSLTTNSGWEAWQEAKAQAVPEGFVLVSKKIPDSVVDRLRYSSYHWGDGTRDYFTPVYQMMIEPQEQK